MRQYVPQFACLEDEECRAALLARADACRARLEPRLEAVAAADAVVLQRFPWHSGGAAGAAPAQDEPGGGGGGGGGGVSSAGEEGEGTSKRPRAAAGPDDAVDGAGA